MRSCLSMISRTRAVMAAANNLKSAISTQMTMSAAVPLRSFSVGVSLNRQNFVNGPLSVSHARFLSGAPAVDIKSKVYVGNLNWKTTKEDLMDTFSQFGEVQNATVVIDRETGRSRGFAFVTFTTEGEAEKAVKGMDQKEHEGRILKVNIAENKPRPPMGDRPPRERSYNSNNDGFRSRY